MHHLKPNPCQFNHCQNLARSPQDLCTHYSVRRAIFGFYLLELKSPFFVLISSSEILLLLCARNHYVLM